MQLVQQGKAYKKFEFNNLKGKVVPILFPVITIGIWQFLSYYGYLSPLILPSPVDIFKTFIEMIKTGELQKNMIISIFRVLKGFVIGSTIAVSLGIVIGLSKKVESAISFTLSFLRPIPIIAWLPVLILWLGIGEASKVTVIAIGTFWPVLLNTIQGIKFVDKKFLEVAKIFRKNKVETISKVIIPGALPQIFTGIRVGISAAWMCVVGAELIASTSGIGFQIMYARELLQSKQMFVGVFSIGIVGLLIDKIIKIVERWVLAWNQNINS